MEQLDSDMPMASPSELGTGLRQRAETEKKSVRAVDQQAAYQPSGNGMKSQTSWLSLAALRA